MGALVPEIPGFVVELPNTQLRLNPFLGGQTIDVIWRAIAESLVNQRLRPEFSFR